VKLRSKVRCCRYDHAKRGGKYGTHALSSGAKCRSTAGEAPCLAPPVACARWPRLQSPKRLPRGRLSPTRL